MISFKSYRLIFNFHYRNHFSKLLSRIAIIQHLRFHRNESAAIDNLIFSETLIEEHFLKNVVKFLVLWHVAVVYKNKLVYMFVISEFLFKVSVKTFGKILVNIYNALIFLEFRYLCYQCRDIIVDNICTTRLFYIECILL